MVGDRIQIEKTYSLRPQVDFRKEQAVLIHDWQVVKGQAAVGQSRRESPSLAADPFPVDANTRIRGIGLHKRFNPKHLIVK